MARRITRLEELFIDPPVAATKCSGAKSTAIDVDGHSSDTASEQPSDAPLNDVNHNNRADSVADTDPDDDDDRQQLRRRPLDGRRLDIADLESGLVVRSATQTISAASGNGRPYNSLTPDIVMQTGDFSSVFGRQTRLATAVAHPLSPFTGSLKSAPFLRSYSVDAAAVSSVLAGGGDSRAAIDARLRAQQLTGSDALGAAFSRSHGNVRRWSQTMLRDAAVRSGRQTLRERTIQFMPSRANVPECELDGTSDSIAEHDAEIERLTQDIEQHDHLMDLTAESEQKRIDTLRALPKPLAIRREIKAKLSTTITNKSAQRPIGALKRWHYAFTMWLNRTEQSTTSTLTNMELWYTRLKRIEGNCGSAVGTYFKFLRSLFVMNTLLAIVSVGFIVTPQLLYEQQFTDDPTDAVDFHVADLLTAQGALADSVLFYGAYTPDTFNLTARHFYSVPHAYFLTTTLLYVMTFLVVSIIVARSYRHSFIETAVDALPNLYAQRLFSAWDFSITSQKAAHLKHHQIHNELREILADAQQPLPPAGLWQLLGRWTLAATVHTLIGAVLLAVGYGMWLLLAIIGAERSDASRWSSMYVALAACGTLVVLQALFGWVATFERHASVRRRLHVTLVRCYALELMLGGVLLAYWLRNSQSNECWETNVGQEIYRLVVVDFLLAVVGGLLWTGGRWSIWRWLWPAIGRPEFDIARGSLGLVFNQQLLWMGMLFAPALAALVAVKMAVTFYAKELSLMCFCKPVTTMWRSAQTATLFLVMVFVSLLAVLTVHGFVVTRVPVSTGCGPFRQHEYMVNMFVADVLQLQRSHLFWRLFLWVTKPAVIGGVLLFLAAITYYMRAKSKSNIGMVKILKDMLAMEGADKEFLLAEITRITHGREMMFSLEAAAAAARRLKPDEASNEAEADAGDRPRTMAPASTTVTIRQRRNADGNDELQTANAV